MKRKFKFNGIIEFDGEWVELIGETSSGDVEIKIPVASVSVASPFITAGSPEISEWNPFFKYFETLNFQKNLVHSTVPVFSKEDEGKEFCGLFAHQNPEMPNDDEFFPSIKGSRYAKVTRFISPNTIETDFYFNDTSRFGYIFFDNSEVFYRKIKEGGIIYFPKGTLVVKDLIRTEIWKDVYLVGNPEGTDLQFGIEDYFPYAISPRRKFDTTLFAFDDRNINFLAKGINFLPPFRIIKSTESHIPRLFSNKRGSNQKLRVALIDCDTTKNQRNNLCNSFGFGLGLIYDADNLFYLKNFKHRGGSFTDFKVPDGKKLWLVMDNVTLDFKDKDQFQSTVFPSNFTLTTDRGVLPYHSSYPEYVVQTTDSSFYLFLNQYYCRGWNNFFNMIQLDRFTFFLPTAQYFKNIHDPIFGGWAKWKISDRLTQTMTGSKILIPEIPRKGRKYWVQRSNHDTVRSFVNWCAVQSKSIRQVNAPENGIPVEYQPGDILKIQGRSYKVLMKERGDYPIMPNGYQDFNPNEESQYIYCNCKLDQILPDGEVFEVEVIHSSAEILLQGQPVPGFFIYKGNVQIAQTEESKLGNENVLLTNGLGHLSYNHKEIGLWAKNTKHLGYYRQSEGKGESPGYTLIDCEGFNNEFNPEVEVKKSGEMPSEAQEFLKYLKEIGVL